MRTSHHCSHSMILLIATTSVMLSCTTPSTTAGESTPPSSANSMPAESPPIAVVKDESVAKIDLAMMSLAFHQSLVLPVTRLPAGIIPLAEARKIIEEDHSYGAPMRRAFLARTFHSKMDAVIDPVDDDEADEAQKNPEEACCAHDIDFQVKAPGPGDPTVAVKFRMRVDADFAEIAKRLDPRTWPDHRNPDHRDSGFQAPDDLGPTCPGEAGPSSGPIFPVGDAGRRAFREHFAFVCPDGSVCTQFANRLFFETKRTPSSYNLDYRLCKDGAETAQVHTVRSEKKRALTRDCGKTSALKDGTAVIVEGTKVIQFNENFCKGETDPTQCMTDVGIAFFNAQPALVTATATAVCYKTNARKGACEDPDPRGDLTGDVLKLCGPDPNFPGVRQ